MCQRTGLRWQNKEGKVGECRGEGEGGGGGGQFCPFHFIAVMLGDQDVRQIYFSTEI